jgi:hypothetical protein
MGRRLIMSIRDQVHGASLDLQQLYPFRIKFRFVEPVERFVSRDGSNIGSAWWPRTSERSPRGRRIIRAYPTCEPLPDR